jgi:hypothetical protein
MTNEEIVQAYIAELRRLYGDQFANATVLYVGGGGWFYLSFPDKLKSGLYEKNPYLVRPTRKKDILQQLEEMRATDV